MLEIRAFRNSDPPQLLWLWEGCQLGRGAAKGLSCDVFEFVVFGQPYFDPRGLLVAEIDGRPVGFVHAGFGVNADETGLARDQGVICAVMVHPDFRRRGIGKQLVAAAESYLREAGATTLTAGQACRTDAFYLGIYGGSELPGFLESDPQARPFFESIGYRQLERRLIFQKDITIKQEPYDPRLAPVRRSMQLVVTDKPAHMTWWWVARCGRFDTFRFMLQPKSDGAAVAEVTCAGLDFYIRAWQQRCVGFTELRVAEPGRRKCYAKALLLESIRRLREEMVTRVEVQAQETNAAAVALFKALRFDQIDTGIVYRKN